MAEPVTHKYGALFGSATQSADYAASRPTYSDELYETMLRYADEHGNPRRDTVADIACGSGQASVDLSRYFAEVIGIDASHTQVAAAPPAPRVRFHLGTAEATGLPDQSVNVVVVAQALHWFDRDKFYPEAARILTHKGTLAVWTYSSAAVRNSEPANAALDKLFNGTLGDCWDERRKLVDALYVGIEPCAPVFTHVQRHTLTLRKTWDADALVGYVRSWSAYATYLRRHGLSKGQPGDPAVEFASVLRSAADGVAAFEVEWPLAVVLATKA